MDPNEEQPPNINTVTAEDDHIDSLFKFEVHLLEVRSADEVKARLDALLPEGTVTSVKQGKLRHKVVTITVWGACVDRLLNAGSPVNKYDTGLARLDVRRRDLDQREGVKTEIFAEDILKLCLRACE